jgi:hypothetical protein
MKRISTEHKIQFLQHLRQEPERQHLESLPLLTYLGAISLKQLQNHNLIQRHQELVFSILF